ncbi:hypothetical protein SFRURICE_005409 [Spodoptera frugiperda]|nr:hypothetical protein SFRURICE_005409 [Spodoptera frugiperda]
MSTQDTSKANTNNTIVSRTQSVNSTCHLNGNGHGADITFLNGRRERQRGNEEVEVHESSSSNLNMEACSGFLAAFNSRTAHR